jgi:hypothetical protein
VYASGSVRELRTHLTWEFEDDENSKLMGADGARAI